ncbi:probable DDT domain-containing protein DDR4 [Coccomyxa sp. Obi]|nr:probable DDT domain-containing protein DDR4 [Coccomyxa sp. Obi]
MLPQLVPASTAIPARLELSTTICPFKSVIEVAVDFLERSQGSARSPCGKEESILSTRHVMTAAVQKYRTMSSLMVAAEQPPVELENDKEQRQNLQISGSMPEGNSQHQYAREDSVSLSDSAKEPSNDSDYMQPRHQSLDDDYSNDSRSGHGRKRRREEEQMRERPDNDMTRKLRPLHSEEDPDGHTGNEDSANASPSAGDDFQDGPPVLARLVDKEQEEEERQQLHRSWEMAAILDFLDLFRSDLKLDRSFTAHELESVLILSPGGEGLLGSVHTCLLKGISTRSDITPANWTMYLSERLKQMWRTSGEAWPPPFAPRRGHEALEYAKLPTADRVLALKALCEARLDREDLRGRVEDAIRPSKETRMAAKTTGVLPSVDDFRRGPLGTDSSGLEYHYFELRLCSEGEGRMYRDTPVDLVPKAKATKARGVRAQPPLPGMWELLGSSVEELTELGQKLQRSKKKPDRLLASKIMDEIVPDLIVKREEEEKRQRVSQRLQRQMGDVLMDPEGGFGRARRERKTVDYTGSSYDTMIRAAIRGTSSRHEAGGSSRRAAALDDAPISAAEAAMMGMRRGRSAHTVEAMPADCGVAIEWRRGRTAGQGSAPSNGGVADANGRSAAPSAAPSRSPSATPGTSQAQRDADQDAHAVNGHTAAVSSLPQGYTPEFEEEQNAQKRPRTAWSNETADQYEEPDDEPLPTWTATSRRTRLY